MNSRIMLNIEEISDDIMNKAFITEQKASQLSDRGWHILTISASSREKLHMLSQQCLTFLSTHPMLDFADICFTINKSQRNLPFRLAICARNSAEACEQIEMNLDSIDTIVPAEKIEKIAFLFTGAGSQYYAMGKALYHSEPTFKKAIDKYNDVLKDLLDVPLIDVLYDESKSAEYLNEIVYTQITIFVIELALAELWASWGIKPDMVMGHSLGEYSAACVANIFTPKDGLKLVAERGRLMAKLSADVEMLAVFASKKQISHALGDNLNTVSIAVENGPKNIVLSGRKENTQASKDLLAIAKIEFQQLNIARAGHSREMEPMLDAFVKVVMTTPLSPPNIHFISNVSGKVVENNEVTCPEYWSKHLRHTVKFRQGIQSLAESGARCFIEIGPKPILSILGRQCIGTQRSLWLSSLNAMQDDWQVMGNSLCELFLHGFNVDWDAFDNSYLRYQVPFQIMDDSVEEFG